MKKVLLVLVVMLWTLSLLGCSGAKEETVAKGDEEANMTEAGVFPIVKEKVTLSVFTAIQNPANDDFENNEFTKWLEDKTNVKLDWYVVNKQDMKQKLSIMMAGGDYTDIIFQSEFTPEQQTLYGSQGLLLPLNEYIDKYGTETNKIFDRYPQVKNQFTMLDGNIYSLPAIDECFHCSVSAKMWVYKPWLDKLNMEMPRTTEDYYQLLKAVKEADLNNNGVHDEIPLSGSLKGWNADPSINLMNAFIYYNPGQKRLRVNNGQVEAVYTQPEFKEGLRYLNRLFEEGLMTSEVYTQDRDQLKAIGENPGDHVLGTVAGGYQGIFMNTGKEDGRWTDFAVIPPLEGPQGVKTALYNPLKGKASFSITNKCKDPEVAFRLADAIYDQEVSVMSIYGIPGEDKKWEYAKEGTSVKGEKAYWIYNKSRELKNFAWSQVANAARTRDFRLSKKVDHPVKDQEVILYNGSLPYYDVRPSDDSIVNGLIFKEDVVSEVTDLSVSLEKFVSDMMIKFITGAVDIDEEWESYLQELHNIGIERFLALYQETFEANNDK